MGSGHGVGGLCPLVCREADWFGLWGGCLCGAYCMMGFVGGRCGTCLGGLGLGLGLEVGLWGIVVYHLYWYDTVHTA